MEDEIIDYASLSDAELSPIIYDLINQGLSENEINQKLWGAEIDDPDEVDTFAWDNIEMNFTDGYSTDMNISFPGNISYDGNVESG